MTRDREESGGIVVWFTGRPSSGKSTLAEGVLRELRSGDRPACLLDGDAIRAALVPAPGYDATARVAFYATLSNLAALLARQGLVVLVAATAHRREFRDRARAAVREFIEVHLDVLEDDVEKRDAKGLYAAVKARRLRDVPGADLAYEPPLSPEVRARGGSDAVAVERILALVGAVRSLGADQTA